VSLLLAALCVRALVPQGFMPAQGELVELCTLHGTRTVMLDPLTGEFFEPDETQSAPPCPFSLLLTTLASPSIPTLHFGAVRPMAPAITAAPIPAARPSLALPPARAPPPPYPT
jgi:hypothetical protein